MLPRWSLSECEPAGGSGLSWSRVASAAGDCQLASVQDSERQHGNCNCFSASGSVCNGDGETKIQHEPGQSLHMCLVRQTTSLRGASLLMSHSSQKRAPNSERGFESLSKAFTIVQVGQKILPTSPPVPFLQFHFINSFNLLFCALCFHCGSEDQTGIGVSLSHGPGGHFIKHAYGCFLQQRLLGRKAAFSPQHF